jgi:hypothetical protein
MFKYNPPALSGLSPAGDTLPYTQETITADSKDYPMEIANPLASATADTLYTSLSAFYIIIWSSRNPGLATKQAAKLKKELQADIFVLPPTKEGIYRISYGRYTTIEAARSSLKNIRSMSVSDAWIYTENKIPQNRQ